MPEVKVQCDCGQPYKFDVQPVNGRMPVAVNCPTCGLDGTAKANAALQAFAGVAAVPAATLVPAVPQQAPKLRLNAAAPVETPAAPPPPPPPMPTAVRQAPAPATAPGFKAPSVTRLKKVSPGGNSLPLGLLGAVLGAAVGAGLMYGFFTLTGFRFPLMGVATGALTGIGARILYRGTDNSLGGLSAAVAAVTVVGTLYLMYGDFPILSIVSVLVSVSVAYRVAA